MIHFFIFLFVIFFHYIATWRHVNKFPLSKRFPSLEGKKISYKKKNFPQKKFSSQFKDRINQMSVQECTCFVLLLLHKNWKKFFFWKVDPNMLKTFEVRREGGAFSIDIFFDPWEIRFQGGTCLNFLSQRKRLSFFLF